MKKAISMMLIASMCGALMTGCGGSEDKNTVGTEMVEGTEVVNGGESAIELESGNIELTVWADDQLSSLVAGGAVCAVQNADEISAQNMEGAVEAASINGVLYAYPFSADNGYFLYYNKEYLSESDVATMDSLLSAAEAAGKKVMMDWSSGWYTYAFWGNTGLEFGINDDGVTNHCNWNTTEGAITGVDVAQAMLDIAKSPAFLNATDEGFIEGMQNDTVIAGVSGVWLASDVMSNWGGNYGAVKLPTYTVAGQQLQMASFKGYKMYGVNPYSEHLGWALKLAEWISNEQNQVLRFEQRSQGPSNKNAAASDAVGQVSAIKAVQEQAEFGVLQRVGNSYWTPTSEFDAITLHRDHPECSKMTVAEDKFKEIIPYQLKRAVKIALHKKN